MAIQLDQNIMSGAEPKIYLLGIKIKNIKANKLANGKVRKKKDFIVIRE